MANYRIDGSKTAESLMAKLATEERVGDGLSQRSKDDYAKKIRAMAKKLAKQGHLHMTPQLLVAHVRDEIHKGEIAQSTGRTIKAVASYWLAQQAERRLDQGEAINDLEQAYQSLRQLGTSHLKLRTLRTSSTKLKQFPQQALRDLDELSSRSRQGSLINTLMAFLKANLLVGLRPQEWLGARFFSYLPKDASGAFRRDELGRIKRTLALAVDNAKTTYGRGNGEVREIVLHGISDSELTSLLHFSEVINRFAARYPEGTRRSAITRAFFKPLQRSMSDALVKLGYDLKSLPTTYSTRHQVVANAKGSGLSDREIAAMFGHNSVETAKSHYGKKLDGWSKITFRPSPETVAAVSSHTRSPGSPKPAQRISDTAADWIRLSEGQQSSQDLSR